MRLALPSNAALNDAMQHGGDRETNQDLGHRQ